MVLEKVQVSLPSYNSDQNFDLNQFSIQAFVLRSGSRQVEGVSNTRVNSDEDPLHLQNFDHPMKMLVMTSLIGSICLS